MSSDGNDGATTSNPTLADEHTSLNSIYGPDTLVPAPGAININSSSSNGNTTTTTGSTTAEPEEAGSSDDVSVLTLPSQPSVALRIAFPRAYPDAPPAVLGTQTVGAELPRGAGAVVVRVARETLRKVWAERGPGPCLFDFVEELGEVLEAALGDAGVAAANADAAAAADVVSEGDDDARVASLASSRDGALARDVVEQGRQNQGRRQNDAPDHGTEPDWSLSDVLTEKKSAFLGRCAAVASVEEAQRCIEHLVATDRRAARATHNISAWRIAGGSGGATFQDFDDDGETAAGGRLLKLLQMMDVWGVVVVVSRWYGGVLLGPARFAIINEAARGAVVKWQLERKQSAGSANVKHGAARKK